MRRRRPTKLGIIGVTLAALGVTGLVWGAAEEFRPDRIGITLLIIGIGLIGFQRLEQKNLAADEIFNVGRERGESEGYDEGYAEGLLAGQRARPVVVPFPKCSSCGHIAGEPLGSLADRV